MPIPWSGACACSRANALSLNFGFSQFQLPQGARLLIYPADLASNFDPRLVRTFTAADNEAPWPAVDAGRRPGSEPGRSSSPCRARWPAQVKLDARLDQPGLPRLRQHRPRRHGDAAGVGQLQHRRGLLAAGDNLARADAWRWGVISTGGSTFCSGSLINDTAGDRKMYFMTANHCSINTAQRRG